MILGVTGRARSGKDTLAKSLMDRYENVHRIAFADKLKESAAATLGISVDELERLKTDPQEWTLGNHRFTTRRFLQLYGTEAHTLLFGKTFWVDVAFRDLEDDGHTLHVVTDVRFPWETEAIKKRGGAIIWVRRDEAEASPVSHSSEDIETIANDVDRMVSNNGSIADLDVEVDAMLLWLFHNHGFPVPRRISVPVEL